MYRKEVDELRKIKLGDSADGYWATKVKDLEVRYAKVS
jgi:hypothetical protein